MNTKAKIKIFYSIITIALILFFVTSCLKSKRPGIPLEVIEVLNISGIHKPELARFILQTSLTKDSLKLDAAYFLISNLDRNYTAYYKIVDSLGTSYNIVPEHFKNYIEIKHFIDSVESINGDLFYSADSFAIDYTITNSKFLTNNLELAFLSWRNNKHWLNYDYSTFKKFILPFRVANEEIEPFRQFLIDEFSKTIDTNKTFRENINKLNRQINSLVTYDERYIKSQLPQRAKDLLTNGKGNLSDINILKVKVLRSLGFAATIDYTPYIADSCGWYAWTTVFSPEGKEIQLDISDGILSELLEQHIPKVYRRTYFEDTSSLFAVKNIKESTPRFLGHFNNFDISENYLKTKDTVLVNNNNRKYTYLAVFNDGKWRAVDWALNIDGKSYFTNIATGITYLPITWDTNKAEKNGKVFVLRKDK